MKLHPIIGKELHWVYLGAIMLKLGYNFMYILSGEARKGAKIAVPDQFAYKVYTPPGSPELGYVLFETEGPIGCFNRAQRGIANYWESAPFFFLMAGLAGFVFPFPVFVLCCFFAFFRFQQVVGYSKGKDGRMSGFLGSRLCENVVEGLVLLIVLKSFGHL